MHACTRAFTRPEGCRRLAIAWRTHTHTHNPNSSSVALTVVHQPSYLTKHALHGAARVVAHQVHGAGVDMATGSHLWFEPGFGVEVLGCSNVTVEGFTMDTLTPPFSQSR
jgi:hypothetical protein